MPNEPRLRERYRQNGVQKLLLITMIALSYGPVTALLDGRSLDWWYVLKTYAILYGLWYFAGNAVQIAFSLPIWFARAIVWIFYRGLSTVQNGMRKSRAGGNDDAMPRSDQEFGYDPHRFSERPGRSSRRPESDEESEPKKERREQAPPKPPAENSHYGMDKHHPDDAKLWNIINDPNANEGEQLNALRAIKMRQARREGNSNPEEKAK